MPENGATEYIRPGVQAGHISHGLLRHVPASSTRLRQSVPADRGGRARHELLLLGHALPMHEGEGQWANHQRTGHGR
jgi:hypothetical protein